MGVSFGADRIEDVLNHFDAWPTLATDGLDVMVVQMEGGNLSRELDVVTAVRNQGLSTELYPDTAKLEEAVQICQRQGGAMGGGFGRNGIGNRNDCAQRHARGRAASRQSRRGG